jgi:hypothetical protein
MENWSLMHCSRVISPLSSCSLNILLFPFIYLLNTITAVSIFGYCPIKVTEHHQTHIFLTSFT